MKTAAENVPVQHTGRRTDFTSEKHFDTLAAAHDAYQAAAGRLLSVGQWQDYSGAGSARFTLCNKQGEPRKILACERLLICIDLPASGSDAGDGLAWVVIEELTAEGSAHTAVEYALMRVRPVPDPRKAATEIAHFSDQVSTSTLVIRRDGLRLSAGAHGRNETANNESVDFYGKLRKTGIALMARVGLSGPQWQKLVDGLIDYREARGV